MPWCTPGHVAKLPLLLSRVARMRVTTAAVSGLGGGGGVKTLPLAMLGLWSGRRGWLGTKLPLAELEFLSGRRGWLVPLPWTGLGLYFSWGWLVCLAAPDWTGTLV